MASTINADNGVVSGSSGVKTTADTSGVLALQSNGTTGVTLDTSLNVGIGTASPGKKLDILSNTSQDGIRISGSANPRLTIIDTTTPVQFDALCTDTEVVLRSDTNHPMVLSTNGTARFQIGTSGQLGIGGATYGTSGQVLTSGGSGAAPTWTTPSAGTTILFAAFSSTGGF